MPLAWYTRTLLGLLRRLIGVDHVALIMDGNRRYARHVGVDIASGHRRGLKRLLEVVEFCNSLGVKTVTVYAFSLQNYRRSSEEITNLLSIAFDATREKGSLEDLAKRERCRVRFCGDFRFIGDDLIPKMQQLEQDTENFDKILVNICMSYGARNDIATALESVQRDGNSGSHDSVGRAFYENLVAGDSMPPQILIRTSGVTRLSDFLIYQCSELTTFYFLSATWPQISLWSLLAIFLHRALFDRRESTIGAYTTFSS